MALKLPFGFGIMGEDVKKKAAARPKRNTYGKWRNGYDGTLTGDYIAWRKKKTKTAKKSRQRNRR